VGEPVVVVVGVVVVVVGVVVVVVGVVVVVVVVVGVVVVVVGVVVVVVGVVVVVVGVVVVVVGVVVVVVVGVVVVVVVVVPPSQCEIVKTAVGAAPSPFQVHVANAVVLSADVPGPGTSALKLFPCGVIVNVPPFTCSTTLLTSSALSPNPARIHSVVPPVHGRFCEPLPVHGVDSALANAGEGKTAHAIIRSVAAEMAIRPAVVSRRSRPPDRLAAGICSSSLRFEGAT
jgi:hypothetical protein